MSDQWKTYACRYFYNGKWWSLDLVAHDDDDASARIRKLGNLQLLGQVRVQIPARMPMAGLVTRLIVGVRNAFAPHS